MYMNEVMVLYWLIFGIVNCWMFLIDGIVWVVIEVFLVLLVVLGDVVLVVDFGWFGLLFIEIFECIGVWVEVVSVLWGEMVLIDVIVDVIVWVGLKVVVSVYGDILIMMV